MDLTAERTGPGRHPRHESPQARCSARRTSTLWPRSLLLGGKLADVVGRKVMFLTGMTGFAAGSAVGGAAVSFPMPVSARAVQGGFAAVLAPTSPGHDPPADPPRRIPV